MRLAILESLPLERVAPSSRLGLAHFLGNPAARPFYRFGAGDFAAAAGAVAGARRPGRAKLAEALSAFNASLGASPEALASARSLGDPQALAVVTGQQTAPFAGPLFTVFKAATALVLARRLARELGRPCVPVFWAEGDDHDLEEISRAGLGWEQDSLGELALEWAPEAAGGPVGDLSPSMPWERLRERAAALLGAAPRGKEALDLALAGTGPGVTLGFWFCRFLSSLFSSRGLVVAYSREPGLRSLWGDLIGPVLEAGTELNREVEAAGSRAGSAGFKPQLRRKSSAAPFFLIEGGRRLAVSFDGNGWEAGGRRFSAGELEKKLEADPAAFSPGVVLRAVFQDHLLPTVAYVAGLSEAAYFGQLAGVYDRLGVVMPVIHARLSATPVEPDTRRILEKFGLAASRFVLEEPERIFAETVAARQALAAPALWESMREESRRPLLGYGASLPREMAPLAGFLEKTAGRIGHLVEEARQRMARELRGREAEARRQIMKAALHLHPGGELVERKMSVLHYLAWHGAEFLEALLDGFPPEGSHHFVALEEGR